MTNHAVLFPGQGTQHDGMGADLFDRYPEMTTAASDLLGISIETLCLGDTDLLHQTEYTQAALFTVGAMAYRAYLDDGGPQPDVIAGHSIGEYTALYAAGVFDFPTGLKLVLARGEAMGQITGGGMAAVMGIPDGTIRFCLSSNRITSLDIANLNTTEQIVLAGPLADLEVAAEPLRQAGARLVTPLKVSGPFHSRYMAPARSTLESALREATMNRPTAEVISNVTARPHHYEDIATLLSLQLTSPVRWVETLIPLAADPDIQVHGMRAKNLTRMVSQLRRHYGHRRTREEARTA